MAGNPTYTLERPCDLDPDIGNLVVYLRTTKERVISKVSQLERTELDFALDPETTTIATLLKHMAAVEYWMGIITFENRPLSKKELGYWKGALPGPNELLDRQIKGHEIKYYIKLWNRIRNKTIQELSKRDDVWLRRPSPGGNNYFFCWYHVIEDHLAHFGQIKYILRRMDKRNDWNLST